MLSLFVVVGVAVSVFVAIKTKTFINEAANLCPQRCALEGEHF